MRTHLCALSRFPRDEAELLYTVEAASGNRASRFCDEIADYLQMMKRWSVSSQTGRPIFGSPV
jgi:hypothetical protein